MKKNICKHSRLRDGRLTHGMFPLEVLRPLGPKYGRNTCTQGRRPWGDNVLSGIAYLNGCLKPSCVIVAAQSLDRLYVPAGGLRGYTV